MKRILLIIVLFISAFGLNAQNVGDETAINCGSYYLKFSITSEEPAECMLFEYVGAPVNVTIPSTVTFSGKEFAVTYIGSLAFENCSSLTSIEIPNSVTSIGDHAFGECSSLTSIEIPNSVTSIGSSTFYNCSSLTSIEIPNSVTYIGSSAFSSCSSLTSIEIPSSVTSIGENVFYGCSSLTSIIVESGNTVYDSRDNCNAIIETATNTLIVGCQNTVIPNTVSFIGDYAFHGCSSLTSLEIPSGIISIGDNAFEGCSSLTSIEIPNSVTSIGHSAFSNCSSLTSIEIPNSVTSIVSSAFYNCSSLTSIEIPNSVTSIGDNAFNYCSSLTSIEIPNSVTFIGDYAFYYCSSLTSIDFGENSQLTFIGESAFSSCSSLTSIEIPNSVTYIGVYAFDGCSSLTKIYCYAESAPDAAGNFLGECNVVIYVPEQSLDDYKAASPWNNYPIFPLGTEGPAAPQNLTAQVLGYNGINLSWDAVEGAEYYNVYKFDELYEQTSNVNTTIYGLSSNTEYCFKVTAVNVICESEKSEEVCVEIEPMVPAAPQNLVANALSTSSIILTWDNIENASSYNVYRNEEFIASTSNPHYMDSGLEYDTYYCYTITATYADTESAKSEEVCIKTLVEGVEELISSFNIYPNPVSDKLYIETQTQILTQTIEIYDAFGRQQLIANGQQPTAIDVSNLNSGVYFIKIKTNEGVITKRFVKN